MQTLRQGEFGSESDDVEAPQLHGAPPLCYQGPHDPTAEDLDPA